MIRLQSWKPPTGFADRPALVVGKGPSVDRIKELDLPRYRVFTLNHAIKIVEVADGAHFVDMEALSDCAESVAEKAKYLFMPYKPHVNMTEGKEISLYMAWNAHLSNLSRSERLVTYNKVAVQPEKAGKDISCLYFSVEALFGVLGVLGFKTVHTIGVDGGTSYGKAFSHMTPLTNGRKSFDDSFPQLYKIAKKYKFVWMKK